MKTGISVLALILAVLIGQAESQGPALPSTITLKASGITGFANDFAHNGTFTLQKVPGYSAFYRFTNSTVNPSVGWGLTVTGNQIEIVSGTGQFHGIWLATGDIWTTTIAQGLAGTAVTIKANP